MVIAPSPADCFSPDGEPLCLPPTLEELCPAARRRLPEVEAELRRRLSGPDRSIEAVQLGRFAAGLRPAGPEAAAEALPLPWDASDSEDPLLGQGLLALCAAQLLGERPLVHLAEGLSLRGQRVRRSSLGADQPPRALEVIEQIHSGRNGRGNGEPEGGVEVCRAARGGAPARALVALATAGLSPPLVLLDTMTREAPLAHAGLPQPLRALILRAAAPHPVEDAAAPMAPLRMALEGRNPWHLYQLAEVPWRDSWAGTQVLREPQLTEAGHKLAREVLGRTASADEAFALSCTALGAAERLGALHVPSTPAPILDESLLSGQEERLQQALARLGRRPLLLGPGGEVALLLKQAAQNGCFVMMAHHEDEFGRALLPVPGSGKGAELRLFSFPHEPPRALCATERNGDGRRLVCLDGGDLRAQLVFV